MHTRRPPQGSCGQQMVSRRSLFLSPALPAALILACLLAACGGGTGVDLHAPTTQIARLTVSPSNVAFNSVAVGANGSSTVLLSNTGTVSATISQVNVTGAGFSITGLSLPLTLSASQSASFDVVFAPQVAGNAAGTISIISDASNSPTTVSLAGTGVNQHSVTLSWAASPSSDVVGYNVYRGQVSGGPYTRVNPSVLAAVTYVDTAVEAGQTYYYVSTAVNSQGLESGYSNEAQALIPSP